MKKHTLSALAFAASMVASGAAFAQNLAIVNGVAVPKERAEALAQQVARSGRQVTPEMQGQLRDEVIAREIFAQEAHKKGLDATDDFKNQIELTKQSILIRELFTDFQKSNPVTDEEVKAEYDRFAASNAGKEYKARHILVEKEEDAKAIINGLKKGDKFEELAKQSKDPGSRDKGGDLDWSVPGNYVKAFGDALTKLEKGKFTETPVKTDYGYHVILLEDVRAYNALRGGGRAKARRVQKRRARRANRVCCDAD